jgi:hypothetical protein
MQDAQVASPHLFLSWRTARMFTLRTPTGQPLFETQQISLICDKCMQSDQPEKCTHRAAEMPRWLSSTKVRLLP